MACYPTPDVNAIRIDVPSERGPYPVLVGATTTTRLGELLDERGLDGATVVVSAPPVWRHLARRLSRLAASRSPILISDGERAKSLATVGRIYDALVKRRLDRTTVLIAVGGGVVGDVAGFAAATFLRGLRIVHVPTTLLAQVDSAIGGKVGVNLAAGKNLVGAFHPPAMVVCDPTVLGSLPRREFRAGLYEVVKYGVIASRALFDRLSSSTDPLFDRDPTTLTDVVADCCRIKADVVGRDEREGGVRRTLNFGHTIGHALEAVSEYRRFRHGEAVAYGMLAAATLSTARDLLSPEDAARLRDLIAHLGPLPPVGDLRVRDALDAISLDKKVEKGRLNFVLAAAIGETRIVADVTTRELTTAMRSIGMRR
jgi:3-dehydroquinate synthase